MSRGATLSIMGLYNNDPTVLDLMEFPEGFSDAQKANVKENILIECAELEFLYPAPSVAKSIIGIWSRKELPYWTRVYKASLLEYNPIENYRRNETETVADGRTEEHSGTDTNTAGGSDALARTGTDTNTESGSEETAASGSDTNTGSSTSKETNSGTDTVNNKITGFDSNALVNHDSSDTVHGHVIDNTASGTNTQQYGRTDTTTFGKIDTLQHNTTDTTTYGKTDTFRHGEKIEHEGNTERTMLAYGNIGVTTSQEMLTQEMEIAKIIEVVPIIIDSFKNRFCLMVY